MRGNLAGKKDDVIRQPCATAFKENARIAMGFSWSKESEDNSKMGLAIQIQSRKTWLHRDSMYTLQINGMKEKKQGQKAMVGNKEAEVELQ